jgi:WXG100 family type VII secretion target
VAEDVIKYDYAVIEECISMMSKKAQEIQTQTDELEIDVKKIMVDWQGSTADAYNSLAGDMRNDLLQNRQNLDNLRQALHNSAENMQQQDKRSADHMR